MTQPATNPPPTWDFTIPLELTEFSLTKEDWMTANNKFFDGFHTSALVFHPDTGRILLLRRAPHDSMPDRWEPPGGAVDTDDETILHGTARELWEEAGLTMTKAIRTVGESSTFTNRKGTSIFSRHTFEVEVADYEAVKNDPNEHTEWLWASEEEVKNEKLESGRELPITTRVMKDLVLEGFRARREAAQNGAGDEKVAVAQDVWVDTD